MYVRSESNECQILLTFSNFQPSVTVAAVEELSEAQRQRLKEAKPWQQVFSLKSGEIDRTNPRDLTFN